MRQSSENALDRLTQFLAKLPGLGPRSARRAVLHLLKNRILHLRPLVGALTEVDEHIHQCQICGNFDVVDPCDLCTDPSRDAASLCVIADVADLWAMERTSAYKGRYHVLGGLLSALDGIGPDQLGIASLIKRLEQGGVKEVIVALGATLDGQATTHYIADRISSYPLSVSRLAHGLPVGGELDYLDDGTLIQALKARRPI